MIRDRIVFGISDDQTRARLLRESKLDLDKALEFCRASEITNKQLKNIHTERTESLNYTKTKQYDKKDVCKYCGNSHNRGQCPAFGKICVICNNFFLFR